MSNKSKYRLGLALSGGGYRAAAFHLGTLRTLDQMKILDKIDVLSTVSGGSIVGADYALSKSSNTYTDFERKFILKLKKGVIGKILTSFTFLLISLYVLIWLALIVYVQLTKYHWASWIILVVGIFLFFRNQFGIFPISNIIEGIYDRIFFGKQKLGSLPEKPLVAINSTNLETNRPFTFSRNRMADSKYDHPDDGDPILFEAQKFPISRAVMASSCVPFAFTPVPIAKAFFVKSSDTKRAKPLLIDGGVYDNQGIHKLTFDNSSYSCDSVITSDAGDNLPVMNTYKNVVKLLIRSMDLFMFRIKNFQIMDNIYQPGASSKREIAYISLGWDLDQCISRFVQNLKENNIRPGTIEAHQIPKDYLNPFDADKIQTYLESRLGYTELIKRQQPPAKLKIARSVSTNLTALSDEKINALINQSELMTELQVKLYCPSILSLKYL